MISFNNIGNLGRLANQMFQYASLKGIARNRGYEFTIPPEDVFGQNDPLVKTSPLNIYNVFENISKNKIEVVRNPMLQERMHEFDEELFRSCPDNVDLFGYFQSPKYFNHIKDEIKNDFKFTNEVESLCNEMYESISGKKVVSLHIRRTDYTVNNNHPLQPISYYEDALKFMEKRLLEIDRNISNDLIWILEHENIYTAGTSYKEKEIVEKSFVWKELTFKQLKKNGKKYLPMKLYITKTAKNSIV